MSCIPGSRQEGFHRIKCHRREDVLVCNCACCGDMLLSRKYTHTTQVPREFWNMESVFIRLPDEERPLAQHDRPLCETCAGLMGRVA